MTPTLAAEIEALRGPDGQVDPKVAHDWAAKHPDSQLYGRLEWDDSRAGYQHRLAQIRHIVVEVTVVYPDNKVRPAYVSLIQDRGRTGGGYRPLVKVLNDKQLRAQLLAQALAEYERLEEKYKDLKELVDIWDAVRGIRQKIRRRKSATTTSVAAR